MESFVLLSALDGKNVDDSEGNNIAFGGAGGTVPELLFEKKPLIPALQQLLVSHRTFRWNV